MKAFFFIYPLMATAVSGAECVMSMDLVPAWCSPALKAAVETALPDVDAKPAPLPTWVEAMAVCTSSPEAQALVLEGMTHLVTFGDMKAFRLFESALKHDPDCLMAHWGICVSLMASGPEFQQQRVHSMKCMKELALREDCPEHERAYADVFVLLLAKGKQDALPAWEAICQTWKNDPYAPLFYAMLLRDGFDVNGKPGEGQQKASAVLDECLQTRPDSYAALFMRALLDETAPAISPETLAMAGKTVELNPQAASARHLLGHFLFRTGDYEGASASFKMSEELNLAWGEEKQLPKALNDAYFRSVIYRAVSAFCAGQYKESVNIAEQAAKVPLDRDHPLAPGTLLQIWEVRDLPVRLMLSRPDLPKRELLLKATPAPLPKGFPDLSNGMMAMNSQFQGAKYADKEGRRNALAIHFEKLSRVLQLTMEGAEVARHQLSLSYWSRSLMLGSAYAMEVRAMMFPGTAEVWLKDAIREQRLPSLLLPPVLPYPEEWILARAHLKAGKYKECLEMCEQGLQKFPKHAGVLKTREQARAKIK